MKNRVIKKANSSLVWTGLSKVDLSNNALVLVPIILLLLFSNLSGAETTISAYEPAWDSFEGLWKEDGGDVTEICVVPHTSYIFVGTASHGVYRSIDKGENWARINSGIPTAAGGLSKSYLGVRRITFSPNAPSTIYMLTKGDRIYKTDDYGDNWQRIDTKGLERSLTGDGVNEFVVHPTNPDILFAGTWKGVQKSVDGGKQWEDYNDGMVIDHINGSNAYLLEATNSGQALVVATRNPLNIYLRKEGDKSWQVINTKKLQNFIELVENVSGPIWPAYKGTKYTTLMIGGNDNDIYVGSTSGGILSIDNTNKTFQDLSNGLPSFKSLNVDTYYAIHSILDNTNYGELYAGGVKGVYKSTDDGQNWIPYNDGFPVKLAKDNTPILPIVAKLIVDVDTNELYAVTDKGAFKSSKGKIEIPSSTTAIDERYVGSANGSTAMCKDGTNCSCVNYAKDNGWKSFGGLGHAKNWWGAAEEKGYCTGSEPREGAVLVLKGWAKNTSGHVAIVTEIISEKEIRVNHANWHNDNKINLNQKVEDVPNGDWKKVRVQWKDTLGDSEYDVYGFIYPKVNATALVIDRSPSMKELVANPGGVDVERLAVAKEAARAYQLNLEDGEAISISSFSGQSSTQLPMSNVTDVKEKFYDYLDMIKVSSATNIGAGLKEGYEQLASIINCKANNSNRVAILISDGEHNTGECCSSITKAYKEAGWQVCTIGFGTDKGKARLQNIAKETGCTYSRADTENLVDTYQRISAHAQNKSIILNASDTLPPDQNLMFTFTVNKDSESFNVYTSWSGSRLKVMLTSPGGKNIDTMKLSSPIGRFNEGNTFQSVEILNPMVGKWTADLSWDEPPVTAEQVNISVAEKSDVLSRIHGLLPNYNIGYPVTINVDAFEVIDNKKLPLINASASVSIQKPGQEMIRMVQAQSSNWAMYKDVVLDVTRDVVLSDDGRHEDYKAKDGIFGGVFTETEKNGAYLVTAKIQGTKQNGESVEKTLIGSFQVGSITENLISNSQTLQYREQAKAHNAKPMQNSVEVTQQPLDEIEKLQTDPMDAIEQLMH